MGGIKFGQVDPVFKDMDLIRMIKVGVFEKFRMKSVDDAMLHQLAKAVADVVEVFRKKKKVGAAFKVSADLDDTFNVVVNIREK